MCRNPPPCTKRDLDLVLRRVCPTVVVGGLSGSLRRRASRTVSARPRPQYRLLVRRVGHSAFARLAIVVGHSRYTRNLGRIRWQIQRCSQLFGGLGQDMQNAPEPAMTAKSLGRRGSTLQLTSCKLQNADASRCGQRPPRAALRGSAKTFCAFAGIIRPWPHSSWSGTVKVYFLQCPQSTLPQAPKSPRALTRNAPSSPGSEYSDSACAYNVSQSISIEFVEVVE